MSEATVKLRLDYTARKAALEAERDAFTAQANVRLAEMQRQLADYGASASATLQAMTKHIADVDDFLKWVDTLEAEAPQGGA